MAKSTNDKSDTKKTPSTILRKKGESLDKYKILDEYLKLDCTIGEIAQRHSTKVEAIEDIIRNIYKNFIKVRETRMLTGTSGTSKGISYYHVMHKKYIDPSQVNREFLSKLSDEDTPYLTDSEVIFSHVLLETGDSATAIQRSKLTQGIQKGTGTNCKELYRLRADYLKRKPNVAKYLQHLQAEKLDILKEGKEYIQSNLIEHINKLKARENKEDDTKIVKALEALGKTVGAFDQKVTIDVVGGDSGLNRILEMAKDAEVPGEVAIALEKAKSGPMIAYVDGEEVYE